MSIRYRSDIKVSGWCLIDVDLMVFLCQIDVKSTLIWKSLLPGNPHCLCWHNHHIIAVTRMPTWWFAYGLATDRHQALSNHHTDLTVTIVSHEWQNMKYIYIYMKYIYICIPQAILERGQEAINHLVPSSLACSSPHTDNRHIETKMLWFWWNFHHWLHWKLSKWQLSVQPVMKISSQSRKFHIKWQYFGFSTLGFHISQPIQYQAIAWTNAALLSFKNLWTKLKYQTFHSR